MPATASTTGTRLGRPSPAALAQVFKQQTGLDFKPPPSQVYENKTSSPVHAVPEFADMGGVAIAYPGTVARLSAHIQLPPSGPRMFGIPRRAGHPVAAGGQRQAGARIRVLR